MTDQREITDVLAGLSLFADLSSPQLQAVAHTFEEEWFSEGQRIIRQGFGAKGVWFWDLPLVSKNPARQTVVNYGDVVARHQAKAVVRRRAKPPPASPSPDAAGASEPDRP